MELLICIDDTDNKESKGTGHLAAALCERMEGRGWGRGCPISRHQLFVHPDIPYTSHNSAMCFTFATEREHLAPIIALAQPFLVEQSAPGSDPGLCVAEREALTDTDIQLLIAFGKSAKSRVLLKQDACDLTRRLGIHLSEHGGTGGGVIGAVAGVGLRLSGNDGRFRGHFQLGDVGEQLTVAEIRGRTPIEIVQSLDGARLTDTETVTLGTKVKAVLLNNVPTLLVHRAQQDADDAAPPPWHTCSKEQLRVF